jgi:hypothetical protein
LLAGGFPLEVEAQKLLTAKKLIIRLFDF